MMFSFVYDAVDIERTNLAFIVTRERCHTEPSHPVTLPGRGHELSESDILVLMNYSLVIGDATITRPTASVQRVRIRLVSFNVVELPFCFLHCDHICAV